MAFIPVADVISAEVRCQQDGQKVENTLYFRAAPGTAGAKLADCAAMVRAWFLTNNLGSASNKLVFREVYCTDISSQTGGTYSDVTGAGTAGPSTSPLMPNNVTFRVTFRTAQRGRSARGGNYLLGLTDEYVTDNVVAGTYAAAALVWYANLKGAAADAGLTWVVVSRYANKAPRIIGQSLPVTTAAIVDNIVDSQRRRLPGRGK